MYSHIHVISYPGTVQPSRWPAAAHDSTSEQQVCRTLPNILIWMLRVFFFQLLILLNLCLWFCWCDHDEYSVDLSIVDTIQQQQCDERRSVVRIVKYGGGTTARVLALSLEFYSRLRICCCVVRTRKSTSRLVLLLRYYCGPSTRTWGQQALRRMMRSLISAGESRKATDSSSSSSRRKTAVE